MIFSVRKKDNGCKELIMDNGSLMLIFVMATLIVLFLILNTTSSQCSSVETMDNKYVRKALKELDHIPEDEIEDVDDDFIVKNKNRIYLVKKSKRENFDGTMYWPYYYYSYPYKVVGAWPPNMFSRMYEWQPGYDVAGWSFWVRPGICRTQWPRNRWVKQNGTFYYINNGTNRSTDFYFPAAAC